MSHDETAPMAMRTEELRDLAIAVAGELRSASSSTPAVNASGSFHRDLPDDVRDRFIEVRAALFQRGVFDPLLARFDTASAAQASTTEIAAELEKLASSL